MKALVVQELSGPSGLVYTDVEDVTTSDETVVIDVGAAGVCFPDLLPTRGEYQLRLEPPFVPGMEIAGVVRSAPEESGFTPGSWCRERRRTTLRNAREQGSTDEDGDVAVR